MDLTWLGALGAIIFMDVVLSGDNAVVIAMAANQLPKEQRTNAITAGMAGALALRVVLCAFVGLLLALPIIGRVVSFAGGGYLFFVVYQLIRAGAGEEKLVGSGVMAWWKVILTIVVADLSMSTDNVVAIAGLAGHNFALMAIGLTVSIGLLAFFSRAICALLERYSWLNYIGAGVILLVALRMVYAAFAA